MPHTLQPSPRPPFNAGVACWERRDAIAAASDLLRRLSRLVAGPDDLALYQWGQLFAAAVDFGPSVILEIGRHRGNSTCVFTTAAMAGEARVVSVCLSDAWRTQTRARLAGVVPPSWFERLEAREADVGTLDFDAILGDAARVLVFWDAHGYDIAGHVLGRLLPAMAGREQLVILHDMSDARFEVERGRGYGGHGLWRANDWSGPRVRLGHLESCVEQAVAVYDFASRNRLPLRSAAEDLHEVIGRHPFRVEAMQTLLGDLFALQAHWFHLSPNERVGPFTYPAVSRVPGPADAAATPAPRGESRPPAGAPGEAAPDARDTARRGPVLVTRARHAQTLEVIISGRADDHGGPDFFDRLCAAARHNHALLAAAHIPHTFTLVEWNPVPGRPLLAEQIAAALPFWDRCWVVDAAWHAAISVNPHLGFMEFFAKNVGIRRSTADLVLTTNSDVFLSRALVERLGAAPLEDEHVYRAVRHDVDRHIAWRDADEAMLADPRHHLRAHALSAPAFANAAGDFLLLTRATVTRLRGFNETVRVAKIHKDGQFCHRAWIEGLRFETLGPIWHLDHDGSYANVGARLGSAEAPYGPEWDWRADYRNRADWGLAPAIEVHGPGPLVRLHHPRTHGPLLDLVPAGPPGEVGAALARSPGHYVLLNAPADLTPEERVALERQVEAEQPERALFVGGFADDRDLGPLPAAGAPMLVSRAVIERAGDWPDAESQPELAFWLAAGGPAPPTWPWPSPRRFDVLPSRPDARQRVLARRARGAELQAGEWQTAALEAGRAVDAIPRLLGAWVEDLPIPPGARVAVCGPDWATPGLLAAVRARGLALAGLYATDARVAGTIRWGYRVRRLEQLVGDDVDVVLATALDGAAPVRLARAGYAGRVHRLLDPAPAGFIADLPSELTLLLAAHEAALAGDDRLASTDRLAALSALAGPSGSAHAYDAALGWERRGRTDEALRLFESILASAAAEPALRSRARFHAGRLRFESGDHPAARQHLSALLVEVPEHRRAREYLEALSPETAAEAPRSVTAKPRRARRPKTDA